MRSLFRWGSPGVYKHPNPRLVKLMMDKFQLGPRDLQEPENPGLETFSQEIATGLSTQQQDALTSLLGPEQVSLATYDRIKAGYGKTMLDLFRIRSGKLENIPEERTRQQQILEDQEEIQNMIKQLPPADAQIVEQYHLKGKSYQQISSDLDIPENSIGPTLSRARIRMRDTKPKTRSL